MDTLKFRFGARLRPLAAWRAFCAVAALSVAALAPALPARAQPQAPTQAPLPAVELKAGSHVVRAEVADTPRARQLGLMHRESLAPNAGMLFVFEQKARHCFWMRNTPIPLSIAFLADDGTIVNIADMAPYSEQSHCPARAVRFALEMAQGWFEKRGLEAGARVSGPGLSGLAR